MTRIKLRGLKLLEGGAQVVSSCLSDEDILATGICSPLALNKINLTFLTHLSPDESAGCITALCTEGSSGRAAASLIEVHHGSGEISLQQDINILSIFVHDQRPQVTGALLEALAKEEIPLLGLASSPSAVSSVVSSSATEATIEAFFDTFEFPTYSSPTDWYAAYEGKEQLLRKIIASYQEKVISIYDIAQQAGLDFWSVILPASGLGDLGAAFKTIGHLGFKMPFVVSLPLPESRLHFSFCLPRTGAEAIRGGLSRHLSTAGIAHHSPVAALFIHGPHFGDRYGIAHTFAQALERAEVSLLAISCAVSSISAIIPEGDLAPAVRALDATFQRS